MTIILIILCVWAWYKYKNKLGIKGIFDDYKGIPRYLSIVGALSVLLAIGSWMLYNAAFNMLMHDYVGDVASLLGLSSLYELAKPEMDFSDRMSFISSATAPVIHAAVIGTLLCAVSVALCIYSYKKLSKREIEGGKVVWLGGISGIILILSTFYVSSTFIEFSAQMTYQDDTSLLSGLGSAIPVAIVLLVFFLKYKSAVSEYLESEPTTETEAPQPINPTQSVPQYAPQAASQAEATKQCPYCGETILAVAIKCKHCGEWLNKEETKEEPKPQYMTCPICGEEVEVGTTICPYCDEPISE
jgi:hypothetical protein